ncbi:hypothetical protein [Paraburkholderia strydomiana]|uniref:hypothetical protein n=1 Tax=Paraburkholderia strydomiana TaxID=1245417 RepID=UPI001BEBE1A1|nr:hypothetical protein [Paraburkholderia strydomiana]MBT2795336.1 hypothetical protein [Paraburkholderia strydomiana]
MQIGDADGLGPYTHSVAMPDNRLLAFDERTLAALTLPTGRPVPRRVHRGIGGDDFEAARALRRDARTGEMVIIAHTALDEAEVRRNVETREFDGYAQKGWPPSHLVALIMMFAP